MKIESINNSVKMLKCSEVNVPFTDPSLLHIDEVTWNNEVCGGNRDRSKVERRVCATSDICGRVRDAGRGNCASSTLVTAAEYEIDFPALAEQRGIMSFSESWLPLCCCINSLPPVFTSARSSLC